MASIDELKQLSIVQVAESLGMNLKRIGSYAYAWEEHDSLHLNTKGNYFNWFSRSMGGDVFKLVQVVQEELTGEQISFKQAKHFLEEGSFDVIDQTSVPDKEPFDYYLEAYETDFVEARDYLRETRGLSDETIDFFESQGGLAQATKKSGDYFEPVIVFKSLNAKKEVVGASLQGIRENYDIHERGRLKQIMKNSDGMTGLHVDIGSPKRLVFAEAPIDLMSYYELHKNDLQDVRLVAMDGLKESTISRYVAELLYETGEIVQEVAQDKLSNFLANTAEMTTFFQEGNHQNLITLAVDNDEAGHKFLDRLTNKGIAFISGMPEAQADREKVDWNDALKESKVDNSRLAQARRKLERLEQERDDLIDRATAHQLQTNGQPMNDKRGGAAFFKKQEELEERIFSKMREIEEQKERIARLEGLEENKKLGLNRRGTGLDMSVQNISRIEEEIAKAERGEASYSQATIRRYKKELENLKKIDEQVSSTVIQPGTQKLIDEGVVNQWKKQPNLYFVRGLQKVAVELNGEGIFQESSKFQPKTQEDKEKLAQLLASQQPEIVSVNSARHSIYSEYSVLLKHDSDDSQSIYLGKKSNYDDRGNYDNSDHSLIFLSNNRAMFQMFDESQPSLSKEEMIEQGIRTEEDYREFDSLVRNLRSEYGLEIPDRKELPENIQANREIISLLGQIEEAGERVYFWVEKDVIEQPSEVTAKLDDWFSSEKVEGVYTSDIFELTTGDYTYMIEFKNPDISLQNMESYAQYLSDRIEEVGVQEVISEMKLVVSDFEQVKDSISKGMTEQINSIVNQLEEEADLEQKEKSLDISQKTMPSSIQQKKNETNIGDFSEQAQEAAPLPEAKDSQPLKDLSPSQTESHSLLHFTIDDPEKSIYKLNYHPIKPSELNKLNHHASNIQNAAQWYLDNLADTTLHYFYQQGDKQFSINIDFEKHHFMHLTGIFPIKEGQTAIKTLHDFSEGNGNYDNIMIANREAAFQKIKVLPDLKAIMETESFYFDHVEDIPKLNSLKMEKAIKSDDGDILLAFSSNNENIYPASLMELTSELKIQTENSTHQNIILGIYQERDGEITQVAINDDYIKDNGQEMLAVLRKNREMNSVKNQEKIPEKENEMSDNNVNKEQFTAVLDTVYNMGRVDVSQAPDRYRATWEKFYELDEKHDKNLEAIISEADKLGLLDKESNFYKEWSQDRIYQNEYHVRLQWAEGLPDGTELPFKETELVDFKSFAEELYKQNQKYVALRQENLEQEREDYIPYTKVKFDVYAPGGELLRKDNRYDIGDETVLISQLLEINQSSELETIDEQVFAQIEKAQRENALKQSLEIDSDGDGIPDEIEKNMGLNPHSPDTDGDGKSDQEEVSFGSNPLEADPQVLQNKATPEPKKSVEELIAAKDNKGLAQVLKEGIREYFESDTYKQYLVTMSKFHQYSPNNIQMILLQNPDASHVASFKKWKDEFGRSVNKGEKSLRILAPITVKKKDPKTKEPILNEDGKEVTYTTYKLVPVFDISQTSGKELPRPVYQLDGTYEDYGNLYKAAKEVSEANGVPISFSQDTHGANGYYSPMDHEIVIKQNMSEQQTLKTIFHEMAHSDLHTIANQMENPLSRSTKELQAESVAFVVASHYGLDTSDYTFGYLATWTNDPVGLSDLEAQIKIVQKEADSLISRIDAALEKYQIKEIKKDAFQEKIDRLKNKDKSNLEQSKGKGQVKESTKKEQKSDNQMSL